MAAVVAELRPRDRPFGVDVLWDPLAAMALARATGAAFMREVVTGTYESDMGIWAPDAGGAPALPARRSTPTTCSYSGNITPEFASSARHRASVAERARSAVTSSLLDVVLIAGPMAGRRARPCDATRGIGGRRRSACRS